MYKFILEFCKTIARLANAHLLLHLGSCSAGLAKNPLVWFTFHLWWALWAGYSFLTLDNILLRSFCFSKTTFLFFVSFQVKLLFLFPVTKIIVSRLFMLYLFNYLSPLPYIITFHESKSIHVRDDHIFVFNHATAYQAGNKNLFCIYRC